MVVAVDPEGALVFSLLSLPSLVVPRVQVVFRREPVELRPAVPVEEWFHLLVQERPYRLEG